jgi:hypothetical protein
MRCVVTPANCTVYDAGTDTDDTQAGCWMKKDGSNIKVGCHNPSLQVAIRCQPKHQSSSGLVPSYARTKLFTVKSLLS